MTSHTLLHRWTTHRDPEAFRELVLRYAPMLLATSKRILRNEFEAEEVTQECFEVLAEGRRRPKTHIGPWLHAVATNRSLDRLRASGRRKRREQDFAKAKNDVQLDSHSDLYEHIDAALSTLPERFRVPLVSHFLEGRSHQDIARDLGVSRQTITYRIGKGIERVRATLRRRGVMTSAAIVTSFLQEQASGLVPLSASLTATLGKLAVAGPVTVGATNTGLFGMLSAPLTLAGVGIMMSLLIGGIVLLRNSVDERKDFSNEIALSQQDFEAPDTESAMSSIDADIDEQQTDSFTTTSIPDRLAKSSSNGDVEEGIKLNVPNGASVSGVVLLPTGVPYKHAIVRVARKDMDDNSINRAICDTRGEFFVEGLEPGDYGIQVISPGTSVSGEAFELLEITLAHNEQKTGIEIVFGQEGNLRLAGRVVDTSGHPIAEVQISSWRPVHRATVTNALGEFSIEYIPPGQYKLSIDKDQSHTSTGLFAEAGDEDLEIVLQGKGSVEGVVVNGKTGRPVAAYEISFMNGHAVSFRESLFGNSKMIENPDGAFRFSDIYIGDLTIIARAEGYSSDLIHVTLEEYTTLSDIIVPLNPSEDVTGRVINAQGEPVSGAVLRVGEVGFPDRGRGEILEVPQLSDEEGRFTISAVSPNALIISADHPLYASGSALIDDDIEIVLVKAAKVIVSVSKEGVPIKGAKIRVYLSPEARANYIPGGRTKSDGTVQVIDLIPGYAKVWASLADSRALEEVILLEPGENRYVNFNFLPANATLEGKLTYLGFPMEQLRVHVYVDTESGLEHHEMVGRMDGTFRFDNLPEGTGTLLLEVYGSNTMRRHLATNIELYSGETVFEEFLLEGSGIATGFVREAHPSYETLILVLTGELGWDEAIDSLALGVFGMNTAAIATVEADRSFQIDYLEPGKYTLLVQRRPRGDTASAEYIDIARVDLDAGETVTVDFTAP